MMLLTELALIESDGQPAATCATCGSGVPAGAGVTAIFHGRVLRFRCAGCYSRFVLDADHAPDGIAATCCAGALSHEREPGPAVVAYTEWCI